MFWYFLSDNSYTNFEMDLVYITHWFGIYYFNFCYFLKAKMLVKLYKTLSIFSPFGRPAYFTETNERLDKYSRIHHIYFTCVVAGFTLFPLLEAKKCEELNLQSIQHEICGIIGTAWWPFDLNVFPIKQLFIVYEILSGYILVISASGVTFSLAESTEHVILRLKHLKILFLEALQDKNNFERTKKFNKAVAYHHAIMK